MVELGSIYGTNIDDSNTLVIDFSNVQINGTLTGDVAIARDITISAAGTQIKRNSSNYTISVEDNACTLKAGSYYLQAFSTGIKILSPNYSGYKNIMVEGSLTPSDDRLKFNKRSIPNALEVINKLNPQVYELATDGLEYDTRYTEAGFIAQDVEKIAELSYASRPPRGNGEDYYHLHYQTLFTYAIKAIQELDARIKVLESK